MKITAMNLKNQGIYMNREKTRRTIKKYEMLLSKSLYELYDLGYQTSPSVFNEREFRVALGEEFPFSRDLYTCKSTGRVVITSQMLEFTRVKYKSVKEFSSLIGVWNDILNAQQYLEDIYIIVEKMGVFRRELTQIKPRIVITNTITETSHLPLSSPIVMECIDIGNGHRVTTHSFSDILIKHLCFRMGLTEEEYSAHKSTGEPFFIKGITQNEETDFYTLIGLGIVELDGKFGGRLRQDMDTYYQNNFDTLQIREECEPYNAKVFTNATVEITERTKQLRESNTGQPVYVSFDGISIVEPWYSNNTNRTRVGVYTLDNTTGLEFDKINNLLGIEGEFISQAKVKEMGYHVTGLPVDIYSLSVNRAKNVVIKTTKYYSINHVRYSSELDAQGQYVHDTIKSLLGDGYELTLQDDSFLPNLFGVSTDEQILERIALQIQNTFTVPDDTIKEYYRLVADLVQRMLNVECGRVEKVGEYSIEDDLFLKACYQANKEFSKYV